MRARITSRLREDRGSSVVEFLMISVLLVFLLFAVLQVAAIFYVRSVVAAAASDGARFGANAGVDAAAGGVRASDVIRRGLGATIATQLACTGSVEADDASGLATSKVHCHGSIGAIFLPIGALVNVDISGQSLREGS